MYTIEHTLACASKGICIVLYCIVLHTFPRSLFKAHCGKTNDAGHSELSQLSHRINGLGSTSRPIE